MNVLEALLASLGISWTRVEGLPVCLCLVATAAGSRYVLVTGHGRFWWPGPTWVQLWPRKVQTSGSCGVTLLARRNLLNVSSAVDRRTSLFSQAQYWVLEMVSVKAQDKHASIEARVWKRSKMWVQMTERCQLSFLF